MNRAVLGFLVLLSGIVWSAEPDAKFKGEVKTDKPSKQPPKCELRFEKIKDDKGWDLLEITASTDFTHGNDKPEEFILKPFHIKNKPGSEWRVLRGETKDGSWLQVNLGKDRDLEAAKSYTLSWKHRPGDAHYHICLKLALVPKPKTP